MKVKIRKKNSRKGITILQDTRETQPILFSRDETIVGVRRTKLHYGDYRAEYPDGSRSRTVFERKSVADLWGTMTKGHNRFMAEMERARKEEASLVLIIEAPFSRILTGFDRSRYPGTAMVKKLWTLYHSYGLLIVFCQSRQDMANYIAWSFVGEGRHRKLLEKKCR